MYKYKLDIVKKKSLGHRFTRFTYTLVFTRNQGNGGITKIEISIETRLAEFAKRLTDRLTGPPNLLVQMCFLDPNRAQAWDCSPSL